MDERRAHDEEAHESGYGRGQPAAQRQPGHHGRCHAGRNTHYGATNGPDAPQLGLPRHRAARSRTRRLPFTGRQAAAQDVVRVLPRYSVFFPYLWPSKSARLQGVGLAVLHPRRPPARCQHPGAGPARDIDRHLEKPKIEDRGGRSSELLILYKLLQGPSGLLEVGSLDALDSVSQHTYRALITAAFEHVHSLSLDFHPGKRTGEVLSALNKGASINQFLEQVTFQVVPMLVDLLVAIGYFYVRFGPTYALLVSIITFYYLYLTIRMAATRADQRRDMVNADREEEAVKNDSIMSYETVKHFNAEEARSSTATGRPSRSSKTPRPR